MRRPAPPVPLFPLPVPGLFLAPTEVVTSPETGLRYRIERLIGQGGFGQVYLARRLDRSPVVPDQVCIKVSASIDGWLREAYFGQLLDGHPRAIRVFDRFPLFRATSQAGALLYCAGARVRQPRRPQRVPSARENAAGPRLPSGAKSPASCRCSASCIADNCSTAI